jgi:UDP-glucuronate 4-epimerase
MKIIVTGSSGFIGMSLCIRLLKLRHEVVGIDNMNNYYDVNLKKKRLKELKKFKNFKFIKVDIKNKQLLENKLKRFKPEIIINLAAQAGVRYSIKHPQNYVDSNITGFLNILEIAKKNKVKHLVYASSSSIYGDNNKFPFNEKENTDKPLSIYGVSKKTNELMAYSYSSLFGIPTTGLRFFTVYGPWGRPDMALFIFVNQILNKLPVNLFNYGKMVRDFTYIDDIVEGILRVMKKIPSRKNLNKKKNKKFVPHQILNIGNNNPQKVINFIKAIENNLKIKANIKFTKIQLGDVPKTHSSTKKIKSWIGFKPKTTINFGIKKFIEWYVQYYKIKNIK